MIAPASYKKKELAYQYGADDDYFMNIFQDLRLRMLRVHIFTKKSPSKDTDMLPQQNDTEYWYMFWK